MNITAEDALGFVHRHLGPVTAITRIDLPPYVQFLEDASGERSVLKHHSSPVRFETEARAYTAWAPALGDHAPHLIAADPGSQCLLLTAVSGHRPSQGPPGSPAERHAHHAAGHVLRLLHQAFPGPHPNSDVSAYLAERMRWWATRAHHASLITASELHALLRRADELDGIVVDSAICHLDYQPRNWIIGPGRDVIAVDFEHTRLDARIRDFARLHHRHWRQAPALRDAFFDGYGHHPSPEEQELLHRFEALEAVTALVRGYETNAPKLVAHGRLLLTHLY
ncbi:Ser/Thr protein kinase RdoA involved in Cpx stress response, MazF antagonist [Sinosporangium album]|uniref:Ser/Thr protein kinase RdoA involved in Cpx stress response, MazF antagonist n=1 Tax=Sinosporangium album TaxID=504805 RepID=A0A1G7XII0_9ACTN|nr:phosphotransferase [Sinosporangium album]SDG83933.1 Ser/Thr protein kinase RdoA involved in Cpx stress response, MazF antagonist [Sinosporangium album]